VPKKRRVLKRLSAGLLLLVILGAATFVGWRVYQTVSVEKGNEVPTAKVQRGDLILNITARGELRGGNPQTLTAPMIGGTEMHLRKKITMPCSKQSRMCN
jgi:hypothetical protein